MHYLNKENFKFFAVKAYSYSEKCIDVNEFNEDLNRITYIKRLFGKYERKKDLKERLILNHLISLYNVFDGPMLTEMLIYRLQDQLIYLKPFLIFLGRWPIENVIGKFQKEPIYNSDIPLDIVIVERLREIGRC